MNEEKRLALRATQAIEINGEADLMYMPGGKHTISAGCGGVASAEVTILVDESTAAVLNASLAALNRQHSPQRALFDKEHEGKEAMAWPVSFEWRNGPKPGVYATAEYSKLGKEYVEGKVLRAFSGSFFTDAALPKRKDVRAGQHYVIQAGKRGSAQNPARIEGLDFPFAGTFTNNPAFREILPLWAKDHHQTAFGINKSVGPSGTDQTTNQKTNDMKPEEKAVLQARVKELESQINIDKAKADPSAEETAALQAKETELQSAKAQIEAAELRAKNEALEQAVVAQRQKDAKAAVQAAVKRGAIPARDTKLQETWEAKCTEDPSNIVLLASTQSAPHMTPSQRITINPVKITREDSQTVLQAFAAERDPLKRATIYKTEIKPRYLEGDEMPLHAANISVGTLAGTLVTQRTLELLKLTFPVLSSISTDFSDQSAHYNQVINTRIVSIPSVVSYDTNNGWVDQDATTTDVNVKLNNHRGVPLTFNAQTLASTVRRLFDEFAPAQAYALAKDMVDALYAKITPANFTNAATKAAQIDFGRGIVIQMGVALTKRGVPQGAMNRTLLLSPDYYGQLSADQAITTLAAFQKEQIITQGVLPDVNGFRVIEAQNLPATNNLAGFGFSRSAMCIVARTDADYTNVIPGASYGNAVTVTDPDIGLSVLQVQYVNHQMATATQRISLLYGVGAGKLGGASGAEPGGQENAGQLLLSA